MATIWPVLKLGIFLGGLLEHTRSSPNPCKPVFYMPKGCCYLVSISRQIPQNGKECSGNLVQGNSLLKVITVFIVLLLSPFGKRLISSLNLNIPHPFTKSKGHTEAYSNPNFQWIEFHIKWSLRISNIEVVLDFSV